MDSPIYKTINKKSMLVLLLCCLSIAVFGQEGVNYDESEVPRYVLPDPLIDENGKQVKDTTDWITKRRPELLSLFESHIYGRVPAGDHTPHFDVAGQDTEALGGTAIRKEVKVYFSENDTLAMTILMYLPKNTEKLSPLFLGLNFSGNDRIDPAMRGKISDRWPVDLLIENGYGLATICYHDIDPDFDDGFRNGVHSLFNEEDKQTRAPDEWGSIAAWAWGLGRAMDYLEQDADVDEKRVAVIGHSRLGKAALWAAATDQRFAVAISNNSGCGGAALSRRRFGETVKIINTSFPHWFCENFKAYNDNEDHLPVDQHQLIALIAPRPVYIASATEDLWADPKGEYLSGFHANPVYALWGLAGLPDGNMPPPDTPLLSGHIGYHIRKGEHDILRYDWEQYIRFADRHFARAR